jgi:hypothetical protein
MGRVLEKPIVALMAKKLTAFCGTGRFITIFTGTYCWTLT